jgi:hypothetical protein
VVGRVVGAAFAAAATGFMLTPIAAEAAGAYAPGGAGYDISYPQCSGGYPGLPQPQFGIVGITGGRPFRINPCLRDQYAWAAADDRTPALYVNLDFGEHPYGLVRCTDDDHTCNAYNYGYNAAQYAFTFAAASTDGGSFRNGTIWWLDVETENRWSDNQALNAAVVHGAIDYLQKVQGVTVGVYSTSHQWGVIAGDYSPANVPNWVAGGNDQDDFGKCARPLWNGGQVWLFQYLIGDFDQNRGC